MSGVAQAIETMVIRGAPAIGVAAAYGVALGVLALESAAGLDRRFDAVYRRLERTRPTARNLFWALERMTPRLRGEHGTCALAGPQAGDGRARPGAIEREDVADEQGASAATAATSSRTATTVLTHCNAGELATAGYGTAVGVIRAAHEQGKKIRVFADETRPFLQGARLTCWELDRRGIPVVLITDNMAGWFMKKGEIQAGRRRRGPHRPERRHGQQDRDVLGRRPGQGARHPLLCRRALSTFDFEPRRRAPGSPSRSGPRGRSGRSAAAASRSPGVAVRNPAFDVTPAKYITGIITEKGVFRPPYRFEALNGRGAAILVYWVRHVRPRHRNVLRRNVGRRPRRTGPRS